MRLIGKADQSTVQDPDFYRRKIFDQVGGGEVRNAYQYAEHPWVYAALRALGDQLTQTAFRFYVEEGLPAGTEPGGRPTPAPRRGYDAKQVWTGKRWVWAVKNPAVTTRHSLVKPEHRAQGGWHRKAGLREVTQTHWLELFEKPNPAMTGLDLWELTSIYLGLLGECFWIKTGLRGMQLPKAFRDRPRELWPMPPGLFLEKFDERTKRRLVGWYFTVPGVGGRMELELDEVVHFRYPNPINQARGQSPLDPLRRELDADRKATDWNRGFLENNAEPGTAIVDKEGLLATREQRDAFDATWQERHAGAERRGNLALLWGGLEIVKLGSTNKDIEYLGQLDWSRQATLAVLGVPETAISIYQNLPYASAIASQRAFWVQKIIPFVRRLESTLWAQLFPGPVFGMFDLSSVEALAMVMMERLASARELYSMGVPFTDINDRLDLGLRSRAWYDVGYGTSGLLPMPMIREGNFSIFLQPGTPASPDLISDPGHPPELTEPGALPQPRGVRRKEEGGRVGGPEWEVLVEKVFTPGERIVSAAYRSWVDEVAAEQVRLLDEARASGDLREARAASRDVVKYFGARELALVLAELHAAERHADCERLAQAVDLEAVRKELTPAAVDAILFNGELFGERLSTIMSPAHAEVAARSIAQLQEELGGLFMFDVQDPRLLDFLAEKAIKIQAVSGTMQDAVRSTLIEGLALGESVGDLQARVALTMKEAAGPVRTLRIARTETAQTQGGTRDLVFRAEGVEAGEWVTAGDEVVRDDHELLGRLSAQPLGFNYMDRLGKSGTLEYPSDVRGPADQVINCRCALLPVR
jgi:phage portal protein BeeE